jgi:hypothetical protein
MATFDYDRIAARAKELLTRFGAAGAIRRKTDAGAADWDSELTATDHACTATVISYSDSEINGSSILAGDRMALVAAPDLAVDPETNDLFVWASEALKIVSVERVAPAGESVLWILQVRR